VPVFRLILLFLLAAFSASAQEQQQEQEQPTTAEPRELPIELAAEFDARLDTIEARKIAVVRLAQQLEKTDGVIADVLSLRMDALWTQMFDDTVTLARDVVAERADGFEVAAIVEILTEDMRAFPERAAETMERLRTKVVFPAADLEPAAFVIADLRLLQATMKVDAVYGSLITYIEIADTLDLDGSAERDYVIDVLEDSAANRSVFLQVALVDVAILRAAAAALPGDASVASQAAALEARIKIASRALQQMINLMGRMQLNTSQYRQQVLKVTGELTADVLDVGVIVGLLSDWSAFMAELAVTRGPASPVSARYCRCDSVPVFSSRARCTATGQQGPEIIQDSIIGVAAGDDRSNRPQPRRPAWNPDRSFPAWCLSGPASCGSRHRRIYHRLCIAGHTLEFRLRHVDSHIPTVRRR